MATIRKRGIKKLFFLLCSAVTLTSLDCQWMSTNEPIAQQFYPLAVGNEWTYIRLPIKKNKNKYGIRARVVHQRVNAYTLTYEGLEQEKVGEQDRLNLISDKSGIYGIFDGEKLYYIKNPIILGGSFRGAFRSGPDGSPVTGKITNLNKTVSVTAGTFHGCLEITWYYGSEQFLCALTFAPDVGLVERWCNHMVSHELYSYKIAVGGEIRRGGPVQRVF